LKHPWFKNAPNNKVIIYLLILICNKVSKEVAMHGLENLKKFNSSNKLQQATFAYIAS